MKRHETELRGKVLVVEDNPVQRSSMQEMLEPAFDVHVAPDGLQALRYCETNQPDLILLDIGLPELDGFEVCKRLKSQAKTKDIPVIFVTANSEPSAESYGLSLGAVDFIVKPMHIEVATARIHTQLRLAQAVRANRDLNESLEARVGSRTTELEAALHKLHVTQRKLMKIQAKAALSTLIANVTHELASPLGNSSMAASTLDRQLQLMQQTMGTEQIHSESLTKLIEKARKASALVSNNLERVTNLLLSLRQTTADQLSEQIRDFNLYEVVNETLFSLIPSLQKHSVEVQLDVPPSIQMRTRPGLLGQVIINLVNNAISHAFHLRKEGHIKIAARVVGDQVELTFSDDGVGIPAQLLEHIFEPYFSTKKGKGGTGLGLAICENHVSKELRGTIVVASTPGAGTTFTITMPMQLEGGGETRATTSIAG